jgi:diguanylate cyclase (GGDEF)-like protein/PAS domain S-box-containing protein
MAETAKKRDRESLQQATKGELRGFSIFASNVDALACVWRQGAAQIIEVIDDGCRRLTGYEPAELAAAAVGYTDLIHADDRERVQQAVEAALRAARHYSLEYRICCRDGTVKWVWERGAALAGDGGSRRGESFVEDITSRKQSEQAVLQAERSFRSIFENAVEGIFQAAPDGRLLKVNPALARIYGFGTPEQMIEEVATIDRRAYADPERRDEFMRLMRETGIVTNFVSQARQRNDQLIWISENARTVRDDAGNPLFIEGTVEDVTESRRYQEQLEHIARHDAVTDLPNRLLLNDRLRQMMLQARRTGGVVAVALVDLDNFKLINDTLGHNMGDRLLKTVGERMQSCLRESDTVARLGGDEFVLLLSGEGRGEAMSQVTQRVLQSVSQPWPVDGRELSVTCSIGVAVFPRDGRDVQMLLRNADTAMYKAKELGRNNFQFYAPEMNAAITHRLEMQHALRHAVERGDFVLQYQPTIALDSGRIVAMEALVRLKGPEDRLLSPSSFISLAEETGVIVPIGKWVLTQACTFNKSLHERGFGDLRVGINLSMRQFAHANLVQTIEQALHETGLPAQFLELELTESMAMQAPEQFISTLERLEELGVVLSIDDFGTGYSNLTYLKRFPVSMLKIDQSFVQDLGRDADAAAIVKAVISLGHNLGLKVVAEGVESGQQMLFLMENKCDAMQGFLYSHPLDEEDFAQLLKAESENQAKFAALRQYCLELASGFADQSR